VWAASGFVVVASAAAMFWMWRGGGVPLQHAAQAQQAVEECGASISGSSAMTARLAPDIAALFLRRSGYEVAAGSPTEGEIRIVGTRGALRCTIAIRASTSTQGLRDLAENRTLVALTQRPITASDTALLRAGGAGDFVQDRALAEHVVAFDAYSVVVNAANPLQSVAYDHLRDVVFGWKSNWRELGGRDAPISLYGPRDGTGPEDYPNDLVQNANPAWINAVARGRILNDERDVAAAVSADPNAFAFMSAAFVADAPRVRTMAISFAGPARDATIENVLNETYPMARRLFAYVRPADMRSNMFVKRFIAFFRSPEAFDAIDAAGFAALRPTSRMSAVAANLSGCRFGTAEYAALMSMTRGATKLPVELHFRPHTTRPDDDAMTFVAESATSLQERLRAGARIVLVGHTDYTGDTAKNRGLALRRALAIRGVFEARGVYGLEVESAGEVCPSGDNDSPEGRERNRRVEIWLRPPEAHTP
jgi:phosphate transport system substrate-binding protein